MQTGCKVKLQILHIMWDFTKLMTVMHGELLTSHAEPLTAEYLAELGN